MDEPDWRKMMLTLTFLLAALVGLISLVLMMRYRSPPKDHAALLYKKFTRKAGLAPNCGETPQDYASRLSEDGLAESRRRRIQNWLTTNAVQATGE